MCYNFIKNWGEVMKLNIRLESFGATCFNPINGKRYYINKKEMLNLLNKCELPKEIELQNNEPIEIRLIKPKQLVRGGFSFADTVFIELTRKCNLRCKHCLNNSGLGVENSLTKDEVINLLFDLANAGVQEIRFTGGEPLLFEGLEDCIKIANKLGLKTSLGTNGTLLTKDIVNRLKILGLDQIIISLDGTRNVHDRIRGDGNFDKAMNGLMCSIDKGIDVRVNSVIMKNNKEQIVELAKELDKLDVRLFIRRFIQTGRAENLPDLELNTEEYEQIKSLLNNELKRNVRGHALKNNNGTTSRIPLAFEIDTCRAGKRTIDITPDGNVYPCGFLAAQGYPALGNIREIKDWGEFWKNLQSDCELCCLRSKMAKYNESSNDKCSCLAKFYRKERI